jgi:hypothetical protein
MTFAAIQTGQRVTFEDAQQQVVIGGRSYPCAFSARLYYYTRVASLGKNHNSNYSSFLLKT